MDEQTRQSQVTSEPEPSATWDDSADGVAYNDYGDEEEHSGIDRNNEPEEMPYDDEPEDDIAPDGARLDNEGNVQFGDKFFGDIHEPTNEDSKKPEYYTDEELRNTPFEQWDTSRLDGDIHKFTPIVQEQIQQRNTQARAQTLQNIPMPNDIQEVRPYTPKELSDEALQLAREKLGLEDPEDFDDYEPEHRAAMQLAMNELIEKRNAEVQGYQRGQSEWGQLQKFNAELYQQPDFNDFNNWYMGKLQEAGVTAEQVNAGLYQYARSNGNRFSVIPQIIGTWYSEYQRERGGNRQQRYNPQTSRYPHYEDSSSRYPQRASRPPVLESTRGNDYGSSRRVDMRAFGDMDDDSQAEAIMRMGLV